MEIKCTVEEFKELFRDTTKKTPVAGTTDVMRITTEPLNNQLIDLTKLQKVLSRYCGAF